MELAFEANKTAVVVIDLQKGILAHPTAPYPAADVVARAAAVCRAARQAGSLVVLVHVSYAADKKDAVQPLTDGPAMLPPQMPPDFAELVPELGQQPTDLVITKHQWGAFYGTELDLQLRRRGIDTIVLMGVSTNIGVESTARDAFELGYNQVFVEDAMSTRGADDHEHTVRSTFPRIGRVRSTQDVIAAFERAG
jgi:nicotinamidase-related amidase